MEEFKPHPYQQYCIERLVSGMTDDEQPGAMLFLEMGLGKTLITLTALQRLKYDCFRMRKTLVIAPATVAEATWDREAAKWDHLQGFRVIPVVGTIKTRQKLLNTQADVYIISRNNTKWLVDYLGRKWDFDTVVLDESTSFKNRASKRWAAIKAVRPRVERVIELTGTPTPNGLEDLWAQVYLIDGGKRLGRTLTSYRDAWFVPDQRSRDRVFSYRPRSGAAEQIHEALSDIAISMRAVDHLSMPPIVFNQIPVKLDAASLQKYNTMQKDQVLTVEAEQFAKDLAKAEGHPVIVRYSMPYELERIHEAAAASQRRVYNFPDNGYQKAFDGSDGLLTLHTSAALPEYPTDAVFLQYSLAITAGTQAVLTGKLLQLSNGAVYDTDGNTVEVHSAKLDALVETLEQLGDEHALIFYQYRHDLERLTRTLSGLRGKTVRVYSCAEDIDDWNSGRIDYLLAHPASCGYGLNLQHGGHHVIWFGLTWSLEQYQQANCRLYRQGQQHTVVVHTLITEGTRDADVLAALHGKADTQDALIDSLRVRLEDIRQEEMI